MFIKRTSKRVNGRTYLNHILVESVATPKGPRHRVVCSLGSLAPAPAEQWRALARRIEAALSGQSELERDAQLETIVTRLKTQRQAQRPAKGKSDLVAIHTDQVAVEEPREAGPVHVGHQMWKKLGVDDVLARAACARVGVRAGKRHRCNSGYETHQAVG